MTEEKLQELCKRIVHLMQGPGMFTIQQVQVICYVDIYWPEAKTTKEEVPKLIEALERKAIICRWKDSSLFHVIDFGRFSAYARGLQNKVEVG